MCQVFITFTFKSRTKNKGISILTVADYRLEAITVWPRYAAVVDRTPEPREYTGKACLTV